MKLLYRIVVIICFFSLSLLFLASPSQSYYGVPSSYPSQYYGSYSTTQPTTGYVPVTGSYPQTSAYGVSSSYPSYPYSYLSPSSYSSYPSYPYNYLSPSSYSQSPININLNINGFLSANYPLPPINVNLNMNGSVYSGQQPSVYGGVVVGTPYVASPSLIAMPAPSPSIIPITTTSAYADYEELMGNFTFIHSKSDGEYIYLAFRENGGQEREALAIFKVSDSGECEYISEITLWEKSDSTDGSPTPDKILIRGDLAIIGATDQGTVYFVDISDKENPKLINTLNLGVWLQPRGKEDVTGLAVEGHVLFVGISLMEEDKEVICALDISNPEDTDERDDLLGTFMLDSNDDKSDVYGRFYNIASIPGYLYISGTYCSEPAILIINTSDPGNMSLVNTLNMENEIRSVAVAENGNYLFTTIDVSELSGPYDDSSFEFKVISISDPENPQIISSSMELTGGQILGYENIVVKNNYVYVVTSTRNPSKSKIYVFDVSNPGDPDLVETSKNITGFGINLYFVGGNLCLHSLEQMTTTESVTMFDISDPENLSVSKSIDLESILNDKLEGWGSSDSKSDSANIPVSYGSPTSSYPTSTYPVYSNPAYSYGYGVLGGTSGSSVYPYAGGNAPYAISGSYPTPSSYSDSYYATGYPPYSYGYGYAGYGYYAQ